MAKFTVTFPGLPFSANSSPDQIQLFEKRFKELESFVKELSSATVERIRNCFAAEIVLGDPDELRSLGALAYEQGLIRQGAL